MNAHVNHPHAGTRSDVASTGTHAFEADGSTNHQQTMAHAGHSWMMIACCIPMLVLTIALMATGVATANFLVVALMCTAMTAMMMRGMGHGPRRPGRAR